METHDLIIFQKNQQKQNERITSTCCVFNDSDSECYNDEQNDQGVFHVTGSIRTFFFFKKVESAHVSSISPLDRLKI